MATRAGIAGSRRRARIVVNWPLGLDDGRAEARVRMAERLVQHARYLEAEQWTERALEGHPCRPRCTSA